LLGEDGAERLSAETDGAELLSSVLLVLEARRNLIRLARAKLLTAGQYRIASERLAQDQTAFVLRDLTLEICASQTVPAMVTPRSLDLAHLRTALWFHSDQRIDRFVTIDAVQEEAAQELGLPIRD